MAPLDLLRRRKPPEAKKPPTTPRSTSGRGHTQGFVVPDEINTDLIGAEGLRVYDYMWRSDGSVRRTMQMLLNPIVGATWTVVPYGDEEEEATDSDRKAADFVRWVLFEFMCPRFGAHLSQALRRAGRAGFCPFEQVWEQTDWNGQPVYALANLDLRLPRTIMEWPQEKGKLIGIVQYPDLGPKVFLPIEDLIYYRFGAEGDNWEGESLLRPIHKAWKTKETLEVVDAIGHERERVGVPWVFPPADGSNDDTLDTVQVALQNLRSNEDSYVIMPGPDAEALTGSEALQGWTVKYIAPQRGAASDLLGSLKYHKDEIAAGMIEEFMRIGQSGEGARATTDVQQDPFLAYCEVLTQVVVEDPWNEGPIRRLVELNGFDPGRCPSLRASLIDSTSLVELKEFCAGLAEKGLIHPDNDLEDFLRKRADLPAADPEARGKREEMADKMAFTPPEEDPAESGKPVPAGQPGAKPVKTGKAPAKPKQLSRQQRELRAWEETMQLDRIEASIDGARVRFEAAGQESALAMARDFAARAASNRHKDPNPPSDGPGELVGAVREELEALYDIGRNTVREELAAQAAGPFNVPTMLADDPRRKGLFTRARLAAAQVAAAVWAAVTRAKLTDEAPATLQAAGEQAAMAALRSEAQQNAAAALNAGRLDQADDLAGQIAGAYYTSILDGRRCSQCAGSDDDVLRALDDPVRLARRPPNPDCEGGGRCRCLEAYRLKGEDAPAV